jgi:hypothetical protein
MAPPAVVRDHWVRMSDERPSEVLGGLPHTRPHRRSEKRAAPADRTATAAAKAPTPAKARTTRARRSPGPPRSSKPLAASAPGATKRATPSAARVRQPAQPPGTPTVTAGPRPPVPSGRVDLIGSAVHVSAELAEIGISAGARALRSVVARLPRP